MTRLLSAGVAAFVWLSASAVHAHELWFQPSGGKAAVVRLTFGDSPAPGEAERVAEIAHAKVWGDGTPLEVKRLADGLEATLPEKRPTLLSAYADRGVVDYMGDSFVIRLAAYAQARPLDDPDAVKLGLDDDQLRLFLVSRGEGRPVLRATWKGKPAADISLKVFRDPAAEPAEVRTDAKGEASCPELNGKPASLLAVLFDGTAGKRDGKDYSHTRFKATLNLGPDADKATAGPSSDECLARVKEVHGAAGPWAVAGYRIGERALKELGLPRHSFSLLAIHRAPAEVQYSCIADGLQASTGVSPGKLNLKVEVVSAGRLSTSVEDRKSGRKLTFTLRPEFARSIRDLPSERLEAEGRRVAALPDGDIFTVVEGDASGGK